MCWRGFMAPKTAGYWKGDHQNNHRHHRLSGLLLGALVIHGEAPEAETVIEEEAVHTPGGPAVRVRCPRCGQWIKPDQARPA